MTLPSLEDRDGFIWLDGEMIPWREAKVHVLTHTLHYGAGVFEGVRAYETSEGPAIFRLEDHTRRLFNSARILAMNIPYSEAELNEVQKAVIRKNNLNSAYIRPMVFYGAEGMGLRADQLSVRVMVAAWEWPSYMSNDAKEKGIKVRTSSFTRHHVNITMCKAKANANYLNSILALREALDSGCEEALLLDSEGYVAEGSGENVFLVRDQILYTPELTSCLDGITRRTVIELAKQRGYQVIEKRISRDEVYIADEAFFTGTAAEVLPIRMLDTRPIGSGERGPMTTELQADYFDLVYGRNKEKSNYLAMV
jgi:branched-chain amino acid aminotransferase